MTPKEAIEILTGDKKLDEIEHKGGIEGQKKVARLYNEAFDMAVEALENQIPKKPIKSDREIRYCEAWKCPKCGFEWSGRVVDYCYKCGQAIDWRDVE